MSYAAPASESVEADLKIEFMAGLKLGPETEPHLRAALKQTLARPGSLIRARLVYEMARACRLTVGTSRRLAVGIEYFHTASLLFDDLPCMDDAQERRGQPCVHRVHGDAVAMLAGLALVSRAYGLIWSELAILAPERQTAAGAYLEKCLGVDGLLNGQSYDLHFGDALHGPSPQKIAAGKTVSLIRLALVLPALAGGAGGTEVRLLEHLADFWGLSYQILDDLKDVLLPPEQTGKTAGRDAPLHRPNLALAIGIVRSLERLEKLLDLGDRVLHKLTTRIRPLDFLVRLRARFREEIHALKMGSPPPFA